MSSTSSRKATLWREETRNNRNKPVVEPEQGKLNETSCPKLNQLWNRNRANQKKCLYSFLLDTIDIAVAILTDASICQYQPSNASARRKVINTSKNELKSAMVKNNIIVVIEETSNLMEIWKVMKELNLAISRRKKQKEDDPRIIQHSIEEENKSKMISSPSL